MKEIKLKEQTLSLDKSISSMFYEVRGQKVMLDFELAEFYGYETKRFNEQVKNNIEKFDETQVQIIDKAVSKSLADRVFGEMGAQIVSQYHMSDNYAQCVVNNTMFRITPVEFSGFIKWMSTKSDGTPGYISVNVSNGDTKFHKIDEGLSFTNDALFLNNLKLHLRLQYPTKILGYSKFEVDDSWNPYWVTQVMKYSFISKASDIDGVIVTSPIDGKSEYYSINDVPEWVDNVYNPALVCSQYNDYSRLKYGLFNFSQKGVTSTTDDYHTYRKTDICGYILELHRLVMMNPMLDIFTLTYRIKM